MSAPQAPAKQVRLDHCTSGASREVPLSDCKLVQQRGWIEIFLGLEGLIRFSAKTGAGLGAIAGKWQMPLETLRAVHNDPGLTPAPATARGVRATKTAAVDPRQAGMFGCSGGVGR